MKRLVQLLIIWLFQLAFWFRYRVEVKGLKELDRKKLKKKGGVLFLPNHPAILVDPALVTLHASKKFPIRPVIIEYMYYLPIVYPVMKYLKALPIPDFESSSNSLKRKRGEMVVHEMIKGLEAGENFLIYPAGHIKHSAIEDVGGASATHQLIQNAPDANIVLVRTKGLWGSMFSRALTGKTPPLFPTLIEGIKMVLKNLIFFTPRRKITIEYHVAPDDFPYQASRRELNKWLENWYNLPDGLTVQAGELPGDSLVLVPYSRWSKKLPEIYKPKPVSKEELAPILDVDASLQKKVIEKLNELTEVDANTITREMTLSSDLGLDSLDISDLAAFLQEEFNTGPIPVTELTTVNKVFGLASKKIKPVKEVIDQQHDLSLWKADRPRSKLSIPKGETLLEAFFNNCDRMGKAPACADARSGIVSYPRFKTGVLLIAAHIRKFPGRYIGILLPASVGAYLTVLACQLAGKIPVMINWTIGPRHLQAVRELSDLKIVLSSWAFLERLDSTDLTGIDDIMVMLETVRRELSITDKIKAFIRSKFSTKRILKIFEGGKLKKDDQAVLLFTSGTESMPKGVPLSHENLLTNMRDIFDVIDLYTTDVMLGILPPFHAYGFSTSGLLSLLCGMRIAFYPNPTDGQGLAKAFQTWGATVMSGAPSFLKAMLKAANADQMKTMRLCVTGAEKAPPDLLQLMAHVGKEHCLLEGYGVTECSPILTANRPGKPRKGVGVPVTHVELCIVHPETHELLPRGAEGLVLAKGPNIFKGYLNPGVDSPFTEIDGVEWYNTGDIGYLDEENRLTLSGRKKRFIKIGGEMISLHALEHVLLEAAHEKGWKLPEEGPGLAIIGKENGEKPQIYLAATFETTLEAVNQIFRDQGFGNLIRISNIIKMDNIPIMGTGKINYRVLEENYLNNGLANADKV